MNSLVFQFLYPHMVWYLLPVFFIGILYKYSRNNAFVYTYSSLFVLGSFLSARMPMHKIFLNCLRLCILFLLAFLILKPQFVDTKSQISVDGIDIVIALDVSGSMQFQDYQDDSRSRVDVAKDEAARFVLLREHDGIGLVIFGKQALSRCPITNDKHMIKSLVMQLKIGIVDPDGTVLARAILAACNRLKASQAKTKVIILLTDGEPSEDDLPIDQVVDVAKKLGIKIYTIGIGSDKDSYYMDSFFGLRPKPKVNSTLLQAIARATGGAFFMAQSKSDMRKIYDTIDSLEKTLHEVPLFTRYQELIHPYGLYAFFLLILELILRSWVWIWL